MERHSTCKRYYLAETCIAHFLGVGTVHPNFLYSHAHVNKENWWTINVAYACLPRRLLLESWILHAAS